MAAEKESAEAKRLAKEIEGLTRELALVLPPDKAPKGGAVFDGDAYGALCERVERCLELRRAMVEGQFKSSAQVQMRAEDLYHSLESDLAKRINRAVIETLPAPEIAAGDGRARNTAERAATMAAVRLHQLITENASQLTGHRPREWWRDDLAQRVARMIEFHQQQINRVLQSGDPPDVRALATDLLRMEVLHMVLDDLGFDRAAKTLRSNMMVTARLTLNASSAAIERYVDKPDAFNRFDMVIVITAVDDLVAVIERVLEGDTVADTDGDLMHGLGGEAIARFVKNMGVMTIAIFEELGKAAAEGTLRADFLQKHLTKIEHVYDFCAHVSPALDSDPLTAATKVIRKRSAKLVDELTRWAGTQSGAAAPACLKGLQQFLLRLPL